jgi:hypothetical protein
MGKGTLGDALLVVTRVIQPDDEANGEPLRGRAEVKIMKYEVKAKLARTSDASACSR